MTVYKKKNGKWYCRVQFDGKRINRLCTGATSEKEALKLESQYLFILQQQINGVIPKDEKKTKLKTLCKLYDNYSRINKLSHGRDAHIKRIKEFFKEDSFANDIKSEDVENFKEWLKDTYKSSNATINKYISALSKMFNLAIENNMCSSNPVSKVKKFREDNHKVRYLTIEEEQRLFKVLNEKFSYLVPIIKCALSTGMRKSEIFNLKWSQIDFDYNYIEVLKSKSGKSRKIPIHSTFLPILKELPHKNEYVFINEDTGLPYKDIHKSFQSALKEAEIENFRFHDLRHTVATRLARSNIDLTVVKELLGHSKIDTTMRYAHPMPERKVEAMEVLNSYK